MSFTYIKNPDTSKSPKVFGIINSSWTTEVWLMLSEFQSNGIENVISLELGSY